MGDFVYTVFKKTNSFSALSGISNADIQLRCFSVLVISDHKNCSIVCKRLLRKLDSRDNKTFTYFDLRGSSLFDNILQFNI